MRPFITVLRNSLVPLFKTTDMFRTMNMLYFKKILNSW